VNVVVNRLNWIISVFVNKYSIAVRIVNMMTLISIPIFVNRLMKVQMIWIVMIQNNKLFLITQDYSILEIVVIWIVWFNVYILWKIFIKPLFQTSSIRNSVYLLNWRKHLYKWMLIIMTVYICIVSEIYSRNVINHSETKVNKIVVNSILIL